MKKQMITLMAVAMFATTLLVGQQGHKTQATSRLRSRLNLPQAVRPCGRRLLRAAQPRRRSVVMRIESKDGSMSIYLPSHIAQSAEMQPESKLVFTKYGKQLFLSQVWAAGRTTGEELNRTNRERLLQREAASAHLKAESVTIAASQIR
jgi:hypothetical protein